MGKRAPLATILGPLAFAAIHLIRPCPSHAAEDLSAWAFRTDIILNTSASGANVSLPVTGFPMLVRLNANNFHFSQARADGGDLRFAKADGTLLPYEIERWNTSLQAAEIWVRADTIKGNDSTQSLRMLWGNPAAAAGAAAGAVFGSANGYLGAWHLNGTGTAARPNSVTGGPAATPVQYDGDESRAGVIAGADSLDGGAIGDHLDIGDGYADFSGGLTFTIWAYPTSVRKWSRFFDLGNGEAVDNLFLSRVDTSTGLGFHNWNAGTKGITHANGQVALNQWQQFGLTVTGGKYVKLYKNGVVVASDSLANAMVAKVRTLNFLGKSNWAQDPYYQGLLDEPELSKVAHTDAWMKLVYQNQKPGQAMPTVIKPPAQCAARFAVPADTAVAEGGHLTLEAAIECATSFDWSVVSGPASRILDPEVKSLAVEVPRVAGDTAAVFRLTATFSDSTRVRDVRVRIVEAIPEPVFSMPALTSWSGKDSLAYRPALSNLAAIKASRDSSLRWNWTLEGIPADTGWLDDGLLLRSAGASGALRIRLCLDNSGPPVCASADLDVSPPTSLEARLRGGRPGSGPGRMPYYDAAGRLRTARPSRLFAAPVPGPGPGTGP